MSSPKVYPGDAAPELSVETLSGDKFTLSSHKPDKYTIVVFYRGKHCPICINYLKEIEESYDAAKKLGIDIVAVSMDGEEKARATAEAVLAKFNDDEVKKDKLSLPIGYGLSESVARSWGLFMSTAIPGSQEPALFAEPGLFVVQPDGVVYSEVVQTNPLTRPSMKTLLGGLEFVMAHNYPIRGQATRQ